MVEPIRPLVPQEASNAISLYFHLPFCTRKCAYCHFYVLPDKDPLKEQLMEGLSLEWNRVLPLIKNKQIHTIYFGGGTPWLMGPNNISKILERIRRESAFATATPEVTLEANPENITVETMRGYAEAGINRLSIGIQSLDPSQLKILERQHSPQKAVEAVYMANECGITNVSVDLMYDLPNQTLDIWEDTLTRVSELPIKHLSLYNLTIEPHTVFYKHRDTLLKKIPDETTSLRMYEMAVELLEEKGLMQYEISAFAREGKYSQHNTGYWLARPFLGLGPSAFSDWEGSRFRNVANLSKYLKALREGATPVDFAEKLEPDARRRELLAIQIRLFAGLDLNDFQARHGHLEDEVLQTITKLSDAGYIEKNGAQVKLTKRGVLFYDTVATEII